MITYDNLWKTMKEKGISQYELYTQHNVNPSLLYKLRHNKNIEINTVNKLCNILECGVEDIMTHHPDDDSF